MISFETYQRIQERLREKAKAPARKDINKDFPLRGFVQCGDCDKPMTACWSKGNTKTYPYYLCDTRGCASHRKSIPRAKIEDGFEGILKTMQPTRQLAALVKAMMHDAWDMRLSRAKEGQAALRKKQAGIEKQIDDLLDRIVETNRASVIRAYEARIEKLEREKIVLGEKLSATLPSKSRLEDFIELALEFLSNPWNIYKKGDLTLKRTVLRLAFSEPLAYSRNSGYRTPKTAFPFKVLSGFSTQKCEMVPPHGIEVVYFGAPMYPHF
ncbi:zinc ribbon domain-containing protein [uncultured Roseobacter sp.]|uniref:zinc ribbon domain-containing protein n=1 Tax=uncultured Roseobacter sp. TaxID=114847 RepID=UPI00261B2A72|nr:zinc ribbon domain-containing protein [uncultured Roseobacter sp.]